MTSVYKRFSNVTLLKNVKKIFAECKMRATKSDSVMSEEKVEMILAYGENYASTKTGSVSYFGLI